MGGPAIGIQMDVDENQSASVVTMTSAVSVSGRVLLCIETEQVAMHVYAIDVEGAVALIAQLEAAYCRHDNGWPS